MNLVRLKEHMLDLWHLWVLCTIWRLRGLCDLRCVAPVPDPAKPGGRIHSPWAQDRSGQGQWICIDLFALF